MSQLQAGQLLSAAQQYLKLGQAGKAIEMLQRSLAIAPGSFTAHSLLGIALQATGDNERAIEHLRASVNLNPGWIDGHALLGRALASRGLFQAAVDCFARVIKARPDDAEALNNLGTILKSLSQFDQAILHLRRAAALSPDQAEIHNNLGNALLEGGHTVEALSELQRAVALRPDYVLLYQGLGNSLISLGLVQEAIDCFTKALSIDPANHPIHSSLLMSWRYTDASEADPEAQVQLYQAYDRTQIARLPRPTGYANTRDLNRRLRIGYVSSDFRRHSVSYFLEPVLANHDRSQFEVVCYADVASPDEVTLRLQACASLWRNVTGLSDAQLAQRIQNDQIDILIDLSGHTGGGRLPVFGRKPAPVQASYLGYPDTTGVSTIDYRIVDSITDPPGTADALCSEKLVRLQPPFVCFQPPADSPESSPASNPLPAMANGFITFGSFNSLPKITPGTVRLWASAMAVVSNSRMMIKARGLQHAVVSDRLAALFADFGIERDRLQFLGHETATASHLARYGQVDIALDTFPYNGTTTTCEALWMGVPVVTLRGKVHAARVGSSLMTCIGQPDWIAGSIEDYAAIAARLAGDVPLLIELRRTLRDRFNASAITDAPRIATQLEMAYRRMWNAYLNTTE